LRRAKEGGSYHVKLSLARSAMWVQELGLLDLDLQKDLPTTDSYPAKLQTMDSVYGKIANLRPPLAFSNFQLPSVTHLEPYGASPPTW